MKKTRYIVLLSIILLYSCGNGLRSEKHNNGDNDKFHLTGKQIASIDSILPKDPSRILFLFNYHDCGSCVDSGFRITKRIDSIHSSKKVFIVSTMGDTQFYQLRNKYNGYIYMDHQDLIRKELKYIKTPIILSLDSTSRIVDYIFPNETSYNKVSLFIKKHCSTRH